MSKISDIKNRKRYLSYGIADMLSKLDITGRNKYLSLMVRLFDDGLKKYIDNINDDNDVEFLYEQELIQNRNFKIDDDNEKYVALLLLSSISNNLGISIEDLWRFMELMERGVITNKNLDEYSTMYDIIRANSEGEYRLSMRSDITDNECYRLYDDDKYLAVLPLTIKSSLKYGAGTKWCTASKENPNVFDDYYRKGLLIYIIDKLNMDKFAINTDNRNTIYYWNIIDERIFNPPVWFSGEVSNVVSSFIRENLGLSNFDFNSDGKIKEENIKLYRSKIIPQEINLGYVNREIVEQANRGYVNREIVEQTNRGYVNREIVADRLFSQLTGTYNKERFNRLVYHIPNKED